MSESEQEGTTLEEEIAEQMSPDDAPEESESDSEPAPPTEPDSEPDTEPESESAIEAIGKEQDRVKKYVARNMDQILGEEAMNYTECIVCNYWNTPGWMRIEECPPEVALVLHQYMGAHAPDEYAKDTAARECDGCHGLGEVLTGSKVLGQERLACTVCKGAGWLAVGPERNANTMHVGNGPTALIAVPADSAQPELEASLQLTPEAEAAKRQGYLVIPNPSVAL